MKALSLDAPKSFRFIDIQRPTEVGPGEALLRVHRVGICGTDYGGYLGKMPMYSYPRIPGHELGVEVVAIGDNVTNVSVGDRCSVEPYMNCGKCYACRRSLTNCCEFNKTLGVMCDGGLTEHIVLPASKLHSSKKLAFEQLALVETLAIGRHAVVRGNPKPEEAVLVIGAGPIGLSAIEFARISGAKTIVMDIAANRLEFVKNTMGVEHTIQLDPSNPESAVEQLNALTNNQLADVVIDATGNHFSMADALRYCAIAARLVYVGITQSNVSLPHAPIWHRREISILASRNALPNDFTTIIRLIEEGKINTAPWITHRVSLGSIIEHFPSWLEPESRVIKAVIEI